MGHVLHSANPQRNQQERPGLQKLLYKRACGSMACKHGRGPCLASNRLHIQFSSGRFFVWVGWISFSVLMLAPSLILYRNIFISHKLIANPASKAHISVGLIGLSYEGLRNLGASALKRASSEMTNTEVSPFEKPRLVERKLLAKEQAEGDGAVVRRSIGRPELRNLDPFLLLDEFSVSPPAGFPDHPHRGFETVTYMLKGAFTHQDFAGHKGTIKAGDLQWMTAGRGIVHCEMPATKGTQQGLQLWVNLSAKDKMVEPRYQELEDKDIPKVEKDGVRATVIAGEALGIKSPVYTRTPTMYLDFTMKPGSVLHQPVPEGWNAFVYVLEGEAIFGKANSSAIGVHNTVLLGPGNGLSVWNKFTKPCRFILIGGQPLNEPVLQYGPFVMNTKDEIMQAIEDYQRCRNGFERAIGWHSDPIVLGEAD